MVVKNINEHFRTWSAQYWGAMTAGAIAYGFNEDVMEAIAEYYIADQWGNVLATNVSVTNNVKLINEEEKQVTDIFENTVYSAGLSGAYRYSKKGGNVNKALWGSGKYLASTVIGRAINKEIWKFTPSGEVVV